MTLCAICNKSIHLEHDQKDLMICLKVLSKQYNEKELIMLNYKLTILSNTKDDKFFVKSLPKKNIATGPHN